MASLYELTAEYQELINLANDPEIDPEVISDTMEAIDGEIEIKADGYAKVMRNLQADITEIGGEIDRLRNRKNLLESAIKRMKSTLQSSMEATGKTKFDTSLFHFGIQKNPAALVLDEQYIENIPTEYLIPQDPIVNKQKMKDDLKNGINLEGIAHLEQGASLRIR